MKKKLLFIAPDYYGFNEVVFDGITNHTDYESVMAISDSTKKYIYKNFAEKIENFLSKTFLSKNLKNLKKRECFIRQINQYDNYDLIVVNRPDILDDMIYELLRTKNGKKIALFWDSFEKIEGQKETLDKFDISYSFDSSDCKIYNLNKINNFYFVNSSIISKPLHDVIFLGTYDKRYDDLVKIIKALKKQNIDIKSYIYNPKDFVVDDQLSENIFKLPNIIPFNESYKINNEGNIILDLAHKNQSGLSFRPFEALGSRKKLITNNATIKSYDFYNINNIYVIEDMDNINIPESFFDTPYQDIDEEIRQKYYVKNWINTILNVN